MRGITRRGGGALQPWSGGGSPMMSMLDDLRNEFDRFFSHAESILPLPSGMTAAMSTFIPPVDIQEKGNQYLVKAEIPGIDPKDIDVRLEGNTLVIRGERRQEEEEEGTDFYRSERSFGTFSRAFTLPTDVNPEQVKATFKNGLLTVAIPKVEQSRSNRVQVQVDEGTETSGRLTGSTAGTSSGLTSGTTTGSAGSTAPGSSTTTGGPGGTTSGGFGAPNAGGLGTRPGTTGDTLTTPGQGSTGTPGGPGQNRETGFGGSEGRPRS